VKIAKSFVKRLISRAVQSDFIWSLLNASVFPLVNFAKFARKTRGDTTFVERAIAECFPDCIVKHGPFKGMRYVPIKSLYSPLFPKLLGCYEQELHPVVEGLCNKSYAQVVDIGCAEGYYAVGFALRIPRTKVQAFDANPGATELCRELARLNGVEQRVTIGSFCTEDILRRVLTPDHALIICDVDGYEDKLFSGSIVATLSAHDLLIELHDYLDIMISSKLRERFEATHNITVIDSIDDIKKVFTYAYPELDRYHYAQRELLLAERRPAIQQWFYMTSKQQNQSAEEGQGFST
jgi:hypothetical protein